jgi:cytochrome c oxidase subunit 1
MSLLKEITIEPQDRSLLKAFAGSGIVIMAIGGLFALLMLLDRTPAIPISSSTLYYRSLTGHGIFMFFFWLCFIQTAFLIAAGTVLIRRRLWSYPMAWFGFGVMVAASALTGVGVLTGADITYSGAVPLAGQYPTAWLIYLGFVVLSIGILIVVADFVLTIVSAVERPLSFSSWAAFLRDIPISTFAAVAGLFIAVPGLIATLKVFIPAFLWSLGAGSIDAGSYRMNWHIAFHIYHYVPALTLVGVSYILVELIADAKSVYAKQVAKALFLLYPFFVPPTFLYHLLVDPTIPQNVKFIGTALSLLVGVPTVLHMFIIVGMLEARMRKAGYGLFGWIRHLPWTNPVFSSMFMGMITLLVGGLFSYVIIQEQVAPMLHNTFVIPAYVHAMAAGGANIIYMGLLYYAVTILMKKQLWAMGLARIQPYLMGAALLVMSIAGVAAGLAGVPRRFPSISGAETPASWAPLMNISLGIGGILATAALGIFVLIMAGTAIAGKRAADATEAIKGMEAPLLPVKVEYNRTPVALIPSTLFLVGVVVLTLIAFSMFRGMPIQTH